MKEELFRIGPFIVHSYGLMIAIGAGAAFLTAKFRARRKGLDDEFVFDVGFYAMIFGFLCTRLLYYIVEIPAIIKDPSILWNFNEGYVVLGGIIGGLVTGLIYAKYRKKNFFDYFDLIMPSIALAQGFGRIGCFLAGCCYGKETDSWFGITFHNSNMAPNNVKLIPTQLISSFGDFMIYFILIVYAKHSKKRGQTGAMYLILYSVGRFFVEFLRNDERGSIGIFSTSQVISIATIVAGIILFLIAKPKPEVPGEVLEQETSEEEEEFQEEEEIEDTEEDEVEVVVLDHNKK